MIREVMHIGVTVSNMDRSLVFYRDILGLDFQGDLIMEGPETDRLFARKNTRVRVAYLNGSDHLIAPPVELLEFLDGETKEDRADLMKTSISEICFRVEDIDRIYKELLDKGVEFLSEPQVFDFTDSGFSKSKAVYFKDPDGIILELMEVID